MADRDYWEIEQLQFKRYACCGYSGKAIAAAIALANEHNLKPEDIREIQVFGADINSPFAGVPWHDSPTPHVLAQFCLPYAAASAIRNRRYGPAEIAPARIAEDLEVDALARRTQLCGWDEWEGPRPETRFVMRIHLSDGRKLQSTRASHKRYRFPDDYDRLISKFKHNIEFSGRMKQPRVEELIQAIEAFDSADPVGDFVKQWLGTKK
jgi:2-methylcitrate dehydratase PrpD